MTPIIQLVGPQSCGKSLLLKTLCPQAVRGKMYWAFNSWLLKSDYFYFEEWQNRDLDHLAAWVNSDRIEVQIQAERPVTIKSDKTFIIVTDRLIRLDCPTLIWEVGKIILE